MSRYHTADAAGRAVAYGFDHACGYFIQVFKDAEPVIDLDSHFDGLTGHGLALELDCLQCQAPNTHRERMYMDLSF